MFFSNLCRVLELGPRSFVHNDESMSSCAESCAEDSRITVLARLRNCLSIDSKSAKSARECWSSELIDSSRTERNSVKVRWRVARVRWGDVWPNMEVASSPNRVGAPDAVSKRPHLRNRVCMLSKAEVSADGGSICNWVSSRFAQSITIRILQIVRTEFQVR